MRPDLDNIAKASKYANMKPQNEINENHCSILNLTNHFKLIFFLHPENYIRTNLASQGLHIFSAYFTPESSCRISMLLICRLFSKANAQMGELKLAQKTSSKLAQISLNIKNTSFPTITFYVNYLYIFDYSDDILFQCTKGFHLMND